MGRLETSKSESQLILEAQSCASVEELKILSHSPYSNVRRCVAKNTHTDTATILRLAWDPVLNVAAIALSHKKCNIARIIDTTHPCVYCKNDESTYIDNCHKCLN